MLSFPSNRSDISCQLPVKQSRNIALNVDNKRPGVAGLAEAAVVV